MKGVFVPYNPKKDNIHLLGSTLDSWDTPGFEPIAIEVKDTSNEKLIRVAAEAVLSKPDVGYLEPTYIVAEIGSEPLSETGYKMYVRGQGVKVEACSPRVH